MQVFRKDGFRMSISDTARQVILVAHGQWTLCMATSRKAKHISRTRSASLPREVPGAGGPIR
jgi:hypothetical protein